MKSANNRNFISIKDISREDIENIIELSRRYKEINGPLIDTKRIELSKKKIASLFFEESTRTRVSFETAARNLGMEVNGFSGVEGTSVKKGEPLVDTGKMFSGYGYDAIIVRHNLAGASRFLSDHLSIPIINAGDGSSGHPSQTLLDLYTISEAFGSLDGLHVALVGDLRYGRTVHSLLQAAELFNMKITLYSPPGLSMPEWRIEDYERATGKQVVVASDLTDVLEHADVLYVTRIQRERFALGPEGEAEFKKHQGRYRINRELLESSAKKNLIVLHPLPRDKNCIEIHPDVDSTPYARYFHQAQNGLYVRMAILTTILKQGFEGRQYPNRIQSPSWVDLPVANGNKKGEKLVYRLDEGTLIDHLEVNQAPRIYNLLGLDKFGTSDHSEIVLCMNIRSQKFSRKDVVAIHKVKLSPEQMYKVALLAPEHTINIIKKNRVVQKQKAKLPSPLRAIITCANPICVSRKEHNEYAPSVFYVEKHDPLEVRCHYCEQTLTREHIELDC
ncbi:MAG: aspartate carbamoyltransferase [Oligoflexia bacterium]|nr:aspartate carbamoyltransferase [Oligoflexia bacterium]